MDTIDLRNLARDCGSEPSPHKGGHAKRLRFFSQLKRTIAGTHISVSPKHLSKYAKECEFRFNRRENPESMLPDLISRFPEKGV